MAVTLFHRERIINNITIINGKKEEPKEEIPQATAKKILSQKINAKIRGKMYGRRTIN